MPTQRYFPRAIINVSEAEETVLAVALAWQSVIEAPRQRRQFREAAGWVCLGMSAVLLILTCILFAIKVGNALVAWLALGFCVGSLFGSLGLFVSAERQVPKRHVQHLVKAFWPIYIIPFDKGHVLWDSFSSCSKTGTFSKVNEADLLDLQHLLKDLTVSMADEPTAIRTLGKIRSLLTEPPPPLPGQMLTVEESVVDLVGKTWPLLRPMGRRSREEEVCLGDEARVFSRQAALARRELQKFMDNNLADFLRDYLHTLNASLNFWGHYLNELISKVSPNDMGVGVLVNRNVNETSYRTRQATTTLFDAVLKSLGKEIAPEIREVKKDSRDQQRLFKMNFATKRLVVDQHFESRISNLKMQLEVAERDYKNIETDIKIRRGRLENISGGAGSLKLEQIIDALQGQYRLAGLDPASSDGMRQQREIAREIEKRKKQWAEVKPLEDELRDLQRAKAERKRNLQLHQNDLEVAKQSWSAEKQKLTAEFQTELGGFEQEEKEFIGSLEQPLVETRQKWARLDSLVQRFQASGSAPLSMPRLTDHAGLEQNLVRYRQEAFNTLSAQLQQRVNYISESEIEARQIITASMSEAGHYSALADQILLPVWLVRYDDSPDWQPLLSLCELIAKPDKRALIRGRFQVSRYGDLAACLRDRSVDWKLDNFLAARSLINNNLSSGFWKNLDTAAIQDRLHPDLVTEIKSSLKGDQA